MNDDRDKRASGTRTRSFGSTMLAVVWSFTGLRRRKDFDRDVDSMNPFYVVGAALACTAIFIVLLLTVVQRVVK